jgi:hypothetical protein
MTERRSNRIAGWCGIVFSILSLAVVPVVLSPAPPSVGAPGAEVAAWFDAHRVGFLVGNYLGILAFAPGFVQLAVLVARIRRAEGADGWLATLVFGSGTFAYAVFACSLVVFQALPFIVAPHLNVAIEAIGSLAAVWFSLDGLAALPLIVAVAWATYATGVLPRWFASFSWVVAVFALVMSLGAFFVRPAFIAAGGALTGLGFVAFFVWTFVLAILFFRRDAPA